MFLYSSFKFLVMRGTRPTIDLILLIRFILFLLLRFDPGLSDLAYFLIVLIRIFSRFF